MKPVEKRKLVKVALGYRRVVNNRGTAGFFSSTFLKRAYLNLSCRLIARLGFFPNSYAAACLGPMSVELHHTGTLGTRYRLSHSTEAGALLLVIAVALVWRRDPVMNKLVRFSKRNMH